MKPPNLTEDSIVSRKKSLLFSNLDDELLAIDSNAGFCYSMNGTAGRIWNIIAEPSSVKQVCDYLCEEFSVDRKFCLEEVILLLQSLLQSDLIQVHDE